MTNEIFGMFPEINTERLKLREMTLADANSVYKLLSDPEVIKYDTFELFTNRQQAEDLIKWFSRAFEEKRAIFWGICLESDPEVIGFCKCDIEIPKVRADLGYNLRTEYWNRGIMTEALGAIVDYTFNNIGINRIEAAVSTKNKGSIRVLEKIGFVKEGILRARSYWKGNFHDMIMFSILKDDYKLKKTN